MNWIIPAVAAFIFAVIVDITTYDFIAKFIISLPVSEFYQSLIMVVIFAALTLFSFIGMFTLIKSFFGRQ